MLCEFCSEGFSPLLVGYFCSHCGHLVKLDVNNTNYFDYLKLPKIVSIDIKQLEDNYLAICSQIHVDNFVSSSDQEKANAVAHNSYVNQAKMVLSNDLTRIEYLYQLLTGQDIVAEKTISNNLEVNKRFLRLNEELSVLLDGNSTGLTEWLSKLRRQYDELFIQIDRSFDEDDLRSAADFYIELKYTKNLLLRSTKETL